MLCQCTRVESPVRTFNIQVVMSRTDSCPLPSVLELESHRSPTTSGANRTSERTDGTSKTTADVTCRSQQRAELVCVSLSGL